MSPRHARLVDHAHDPPFWPENRELSLLTREEELRDFAQIVRRRDGGGGLHQVGGNRQRVKAFLGGDEADGRGAHDAEQRPGSRQHREGALVGAAVNARNIVPIGVPGSNVSWPTGVVITSRACSELRTSSDAAGR